MRNCIAVFSVAAVLLVALTGCGGGGGGNSTGSGDLPGGGIVAGDTVVKGRVMIHTARPTIPVANVRITLGSMGTLTTDADGRFSFNLGYNRPIGSVFTDPVEAAIKVDTSLLDPDKYPPSANVFYNGKGYERFNEGGILVAAIPLDFDYNVAGVYKKLYEVSGVTVDLLITVRYFDENNPPGI